MILPSMVVMALGISLVTNATPVSPDPEGLAESAAVQIIEQPTSPKVKVEGKIETRNASGTPVESTSAEAAWLKLALELVAADRDTAEARVSTLERELLRLRVESATRDTASTGSPSDSATETPGDSNQTLIGSPHRR